MPKSWTNPFVKDTRQMFGLHPQSRGLKAFLPAIRLFKYLPATARFTIICDRGQSYSAGLYEHDFSLKSTHQSHISWRPSTWKLSNEQYIILLPFVFHGDRSFDPEQTGILAKVVGPVTRYVARVFVIRDSASGNTVEGKCIDPCWWLVD